MHGKVKSTDSLATCNHSLYHGKGLDELGKKANDEFSDWMVSQLAAQLVPRRTRDRREVNSSFCIAIVRLDQHVHAVSIAALSREGKYKLVCCFNQEQRKTIDNVVYLPIPHQRFVYIPRTIVVTDIRMGKVTHWWKSVH